MPNQKDVQATAPEQPLRRRLIQASTATLVTTVLSRPVWASHCSISGNLSGNLSGQHHNEPCILAGYSPGGWLYGHANNHDLWRFISFGKGTSAATVLGHLNPDSNLLGMVPEATVADALGGGNHGWERQAVCAILNALLWEALLIECSSNPTTCTALDDISEGFYFPLTVSSIRTAYHNKSSADRTAWEAAQTL